MAFVGPALRAACFCRGLLCRLGPAQPALLNKQEELCAYFALRGWRVWPCLYGH